MGGLTDVFHLHDFNSHCCVENLIKTEYGLTVAWLGYGYVNENVNIQLE